MNQSIETHLDQVFEDGARELAAAWKSTRAKITLLDRDYHPTETFIGKVVNVRYSKIDDCNIYVVQKDGEEETISRLEFFIKVAALD